MDTGDLIPPSLPLQKGEIPPLWQRGVRGDFGRMCLINYGLLSMVLIGSFLGIFIPISVPAIDGSYDIYGDKSDSTVVQAIGETVGIYKTSSNSTIAEVIDEPSGIYEDWSSPNIRSDRWLVRTDRAHEARREVLGHNALMGYRLLRLTI